MSSVRFWEDAAVACKWSVFCSSAFVLCCLTVSGLMAWIQRKQRRETRQTQGFAYYMIVLEAVDALPEAAMLAQTTIRGTAGWSFALSVFCLNFINTATSSTDYLSTSTRHRTHQALYVVMLFNVGMIVYTIPTGVYGRFKEQYAEGDRSDLHLLLLLLGTAVGLLLIFLIRRIDARMRAESRKADLGASGPSDRSSEEDSDARAAKTVASPEAALLLAKIRTLEREAEAERNTGKLRGQRVAKRNADRARVLGGLVGLMEFEATWKEVQGYENQALKAVRERLIAEAESDGASESDVPSTPRDFRDPSEEDDERGEGGGGGEEIFYDRDCDVVVVDAGRDFETVVPSTPRSIVAQSLEDSGEGAPVRLSESKILEREDEESLRLHERRSEVVPFWQRVCILNLLYCFMFVWSVGLTFVVTVILSKVESADSPAMDYVDAFAQGASGGAFIATMGGTMLSRVRYDFMASRWKESFSEVVAIVSITLGLVFCAVVDMVTGTRLRAR